MGGFMTIRESGTKLRQDEGGLPHLVRRSRVSSSRTPVHAGPTSPDRPVRMVVCRFVASFFPAVLQPMGRQLAAHRNPRFEGETPPELRGGPSLRSPRVRYLGVSRRASQVSQSRPSYRRTNAGRGRGREPFVRYRDGPRVVASAIVPKPPGT